MSYFTTNDDVFSKIKFKKTRDLRLITINGFDIPYESYLNSNLFVMYDKNNNKTYHYSFWDMNKRIIAIKKNIKDYRIVTNYFYKNRMSYNISLDLVDGEVIFTFKYGKNFSILFSDITMILRIQLSINYVINSSYYMNMCGYPYNKKYNNAPPLFESLMKASSMSRPVESIIRTELDKYLNKDVSSVIMQYVGKCPVDGPLYNSSIRVLFKSDIYNSSILEKIIRMLF